MIRTEIMDEAWRSYLQEKTGKSFGLINVPDAADRTMPYGVIQPIVAGAGSGPWADPESEREFVYQVTLVGVDHRMTAWLRDRVSKWMVDRQPDGNYTPIVISGIEVTYRAVDSLGMMVPTDELYQVPDTYRVRANT